MIKKGQIKKRDTFYIIDSRLSAQHYIPEHHLTKLRCSDIIAYDVVHSKKRDKDYMLIKAKKGLVYGYYALYDSYECYRTKKEAMEALKKVYKRTISDLKKIIKRDSEKLEQLTKQYKEI
jgi:hypothetical protein